MEFIGAIIFSGDILSLVCLFRVLGAGVRSIKAVGKSFWGWLIKGKF